MPVIEAKDIIKDFGGSLEFTVEEGVGTTFTISLPMATAEEIASAEQVEAMTTDPRRSAPNG